MQTQRILLLMGLVAGQAGASIIDFYNNIVPANENLAFGVAFSTPYDGIGDSIDLGSPVTGATDAFLELFNNGGVSGTFDATLEFFTPAAPVGSQLGSTFSLTGNSVDAGSEVMLDFSLGGLNLPSSVVFLLQVQNLSGGLDLAVDLFGNPPGPGSNTADTAIVQQGAGYSQVSTGLAGSGNPSFELTGTPEPGSFLLLAGGLAGLVWQRRRARGRSVVRTMRHFGRA